MSQIPTISDTTITTRCQIMTNALANPSQYCASSPGVGLAGLLLWIPLRIYAHLLRLHGKLQMRTSSKWNINESRKLAFNQKLRILFFEFSCPCAQNTKAPACSCRIPCRSVLPTNTLEVQINLPHPKDSKVPPNMWFCVKTLVPSGTLGSLK